MTSLSDIQDRGSAEIGDRTGSQRQNFCAHLTGTDDHGQDESVSVRLRRRERPGSAMHSFAPTMAPRQREVEVS